MNYQLQPGSIILAHPDDSSVPEEWQLFKVLDMVNDDVLVICLENVSPAHRTSLISIPMVHIRACGYEVDLTAKEECENTENIPRKSSARSRKKSGHD